MNNPPSLLITGASGFVGSHLVEAALDAGYEVWAAVRATSSRQWLKDQRIHFIELNLNDASALTKQLLSFNHLHFNTGWDYIIHAAGATKARNEQAFMQANLYATKNLVQALIDCEMKPRRLVFMSSLSAVAMKDGLPSGQPAPTAYGRSKHEAEKFLHTMQSQIESVILRPTGVYGPRERDYFLMAQSICRHVDFSVGHKPQQITFIYVADLCQAALKALVQGKSTQVYQLSDGATYSSRDFSRLLKKETSTRLVAHITAPLWLLYAVCSGSEFISKLTGRTSTLNKDKYNILKQRDWQCDISSARRELGYEPQFPLSKGVHLTVEWYKKHKWL